MAGIRIRPRPELGFPGDALVVIVDHARPFSPPPGQRIEVTQPECSACGVQHFAKNYHIQLRDGEAIVSEGVWESFQRLREPDGVTPNNPFEVVNAVSDPPVQHLSLAPALYFPSGVLND